MAERVSGFRRLPKKVLVVDSDSDTRVMFGYALRADGHDVEALRSVSELYDRILCLGAEAISVVVVVLREVDTVLEILCRALVIEGRITVLAVTALGPADADARAALMGATWFSKPLDVERVRTAVRTETQRLAWREPRLEQLSQRR